MPIFRYRCQTPHAEALVAPAAAGLEAVLVQEFSRRSPMKRRAFEIQRTPVAILAVHIGLPVRESGRDQPHRAGAREIGQRASDIRKRQADRAIPAQDGVASWQSISSENGQMVVAANLASRGARSQALDQLRIDLNPYIGPSE